MHIFDQAPYQTRSHFQVSVVLQQATCQWDGKSRSNGAQCFKRRCSSVLVRVTSSADAVSKNRYRASVVKELYSTNGVEDEDTEGQILVMDDRVNMADAWVDARGSST
jgi:hypothetical protein